MSLVAVIDVGTGNLRSVQKALEHVASERNRVEITDDPKVVGSADRVIFPGQSAMGSCLDRLMDQPQLMDAVRTALRDRPFLGICIGLQALFRFSEEDGGVAGLGLLEGTVRHFRNLEGFSAVADRQALKIPHMGWNTVKQTYRHALWDEIPQGSRFYFVHSYCARSEREQEVFGTTEYGVTFTSAAGRDNLFAVQFHPEKSQESGLKLMRNFLEWDGSCS